MSNGFGFTANNDNNNDNSDNNKDNNNDHNNNGASGPFGGLFNMFGFQPGSSGSGFPFPFGPPASGSPGATGGFVSWTPEEGFTGGGPLGDMLRQFSHMMERNGEETGAVLNADLMIKSGSEAIKQSGRDPRPRSGDETLVSEAVRLAELWLDEVTDIATSQAPTQIWNAGQWLSHTVHTWIRLAEPVVDSRGSANQDSVPEEAKEMVAPVMNLMNKFSHMQASGSIGVELGELATHTLTGSDLGIPVTTGEIVVLTDHVREAVSDLSVPQQEAFVYIVTREAARQRLFAHAPWIGESLISAIEEYAAGLTIDTSAMDEALRDMQSGEFDPQRIQETLNNLRGEDLEPKIYTRNDYSTSRFKTLVALIEGWVDVVTHQALRERIPSTAQMEEAWHNRRSAGFVAESALAEALDIELGEPLIDAAVDLWQRVEFAVGRSKRDHIWDHPDFLPTAADLHSSAEFIDKLLAESTEMDDFDPIAEINRLEAEKGDDSPE